MEKKILVASGGQGMPKWLIAAIVLAVIGLLVLIILVAAGVATPDGRVALIRVSGVIGVGGPLEQHVDTDEIIGMIHRAEEDVSVKAILLEINSPGGAPVASEEIMKVVRDSPKPVVAVIRDVGTSGAYWVASAADYVIASPVSLTGSVGVTGSYLEFSGLMELYGVRYERLVSAPYKDTGTPFRNLTEEERATMLDAIENMHQYFLDSVLENRGITDEDDIAAISTALVFLGGESLDLGLVDEVGGRAEAVEWLFDQTNLSEFDYASYEPRPLFDLGGLLTSQSAAAGAAFGNTLLSTLGSTRSEIRT